MANKYLISASLLTFVLQACGAQKDANGDLTRENDQLRQENRELFTASEKAKADREQAAAAQQTAEQELAASAKALEDSEKTRSDLQLAFTNLQDQKAAAEKERLRLENALKVKAQESIDLRKSIDDKNKQIAGLNDQITQLRAAVSPDPQLIGSLQDQIKALTTEKETLQNGLNQALLDKDNAEKSLAEANQRIALLQNQMQSTVATSIKNVQGLWLNQKPLASIASANCYEFVHIATDGTLTQAISCADGRLQMNRQVLERLSAEGYRPGISSDFESTYGFVLVGGKASSSCKDPAASLLKVGDRAIFEMSLQDFGRDVSDLDSRYMVVPQGETYKPFQNAAFNFGTNNFSYAAMLAYSNLPNRGALSRSAAVLLGGIEGQIVAGCFDATGAFVPSETQN